MRSRETWLSLLAITLFSCLSAQTEAQIDPEKRRLVQLGYNQPLEGKGPIAGYGFYYHNQPNFFSTNLTLRLAIAPIYLDSELGYRALFGPHTDVAIGISGGGFADSYSEIREGKYLPQESFTGHGAEVSASVYHLLNPANEIPLYLIFRAGLHQSYYVEDSDTEDTFVLPDDRSSFEFRTGLRFGGQEPSMTEPLALELSVWHESQFRTDTGRYGFGGDRRTQPDSHLFWSRALFKYMFENEYLIEMSLTAGTSIDADRFSAFRLGGVLPFASEFPLSIPGYYFQEISAKRFALLNAQFSFPIVPSRSLRFTTFGATGPVRYVEGLDQSGNWHNGVGAGLSYISPSGTWLVTLIYGHGFNSIRSHGRGSNQVGIIFQYDFDAKARGKSRWFIPGVDPYRSRGGERIFRDSFF